jgi:multicomponent Na+:H+ antiporter subunit G
MKVREIIALVPLFCAAGIIVTSCVGLLYGGVYDRLHFVGPPSVLAPGLLAAAVTIQFAFTEAVIKSILLAAAMMLINPILTHATAKMVHRLRYEEDHAEERLR